MSSSNILPLILLFASLIFPTTLGEIICEELSTEVCAFSISSSAKRCLLENLETEKGMGYQCTTSDVIVQRMAEHIETDACVDACGVDRTTVGISSDSLLEPQFTARLCSAYCYHNCPNIIDLYFNLAAGEGVYLPDLCEKQKTNPLRAMQNLMNYVHIRALSSNYDPEEDALSPSSESDTTEADAPAPAPSSETAENEDDAPAPAPLSESAENEYDAPAPSSESDENEEGAPAPSSETGDNEDYVPSLLSGGEEDEEDEEDEEYAPAPSSEIGENEEDAPAPAPSSETDEGEEGAPSPTLRSIIDEVEEDFFDPALYEVEEDVAAPSYH